MRTCSLFHWVALLMVTSGCGFDVTTPPIRIEFIDGAARPFRPKEPVEVTVRGRVAVEGTAAEVFETRKMVLQPGESVMKPFRLAHDSGSDPSLEIILPDDGEIVASNDVAYQCRPSVQVSSERLDSTAEQLLRVGCESHPNRIRGASFVCADRPYLEVAGTFAELRKVAGTVAFSEDVAATMRVGFRFGDERAPFAEILTRFSRTNVIAGTAEARHWVEAVAYSMPAARDFQFPEPLQRLQHGMDAGFLASENPRDEDLVGKVMPKTRCRADECQLRFLWPVVPTAKRRVEVTVHLDRAGRRDPTFRMEAAPCAAAAEAAPATPGAGG